MRLGPEPMEIINHSPLILLVDDEQIIRNLLRVTLQRQGYHVLEASNGSEAITVFNEHESSIALVLTDVMMPKMGGVELAERLTEKRPTLPILFISGYCETIPKEPNFLGCIPKPFTAQEIVERVSNILSLETIELSAICSNEAPSRLTPQSGSA